MKYIMGLVVGFAVYVAFAGFSLASSVDHVGEDKEWKVTFNQEISDRDIEDYVDLYIGMDSSDEREGDVAVRVDGNVMYVSGEYEIGEVHTLEIYSGITSVSGNELVEGARVVFMVVEEGNDVSMADMFSDMRDEFHLIDRVGSEYDFGWDVRKKENGELLLVGNNQEGIRSIFTNSRGVEYEGIRVGRELNEDAVRLDEVDAVKRADGMYQLGDEGLLIYEYENGYVYVYIDNLDNDKVLGIRIVRGSDEEKMEGFYGDASNYRTDMEDLMGYMLNSERVVRGLSELTRSSEADEVAYRHSEDMVDRHFFDHVNPDGDTVLTRMQRMFNDLGSVGENLAYGQSNAIDAHYGLVNSEGHRENIVSHDYAGYGVGVEFGDGDTPFYTIKFFR